jgi:branched-chain amino acid transport system substrate-binding protein
LGVTGSLASIYKPKNDALTAYFDYVNAHGGVNGHQIKYVSLDDQTNPSIGVTNVKQLLANDHPSVIIASNSDVIGAFAPISEKAQVPVVTSALAPSQLDPPSPYFFSSAILETQLSGPLVDFASEQLHVASGANVAVLGGQSTAIDELDSNLGKDAEAKGWNVVYNQNIPLTETNLSTEVSAIVSKHPAAIFSTFTPAALPGAIAKSRQLGYEGPWVLWSNAYNLPILKTIHETGVYLEQEETDGTGDTPELQALRAASSAAGSSYTQYLWTQAYVNGWDIVQALKRCTATCTGPDFSKAMESIGTLTSAQTGDLYPGSVTWDATTHGGPTEVGFVALKDGTPTPIGTAVKAAA